VLVFAFFSASQSKLIPYVLPIWPALSVLLALGIERARQRGAEFRVDRRLSAAFFGLLFAAAAAYGWGAGYLERFGSARTGLLALSALLGGFVLNVSPRLFGARRGRSRRGRSPRPPSRFWNRTISSCRRGTTSRCFRSTSGASRRWPRSGGASWTSAAHTQEPRRSFRPRRLSRKSG